MSRLPLSPSSSTTAHRGPLLSIAVGTHGVLPEFHGSMVADTAYTWVYPLISSTCHMIGLKGFLAQRRVLNLSVFSLEKPWIEQDQKQSATNEGYTLVDE